MTPRRTLALVCYPSLGGSGVIACELANGLAARGHEVHLLASAQPARLEPGERLTFHEILTPGYPLFEHAPYTISLANQLVELASSRRLDLINVHYAVPHATSAMLARQLLGARAPRLVVSLHGTDVTTVGADPSYRAVTAASVLAADAITTPSGWLCEQARTQLGLPVERRIEVITNFVDTAEFQPPTERRRAHFAELFGSPCEGPVLFHVSNFRPVKRVDDLLEVLLRMRRRVPARLVLVGDGPERQALEGRAARLGLSAEVRFLGKRDDFAADLRQADAFVLPSECESFGVAALEALASGVPVFAYRVGGLPDLVNPEVGRLVPPHDLDALAAALLEVTSAPETRARMGHAARAHVLASFDREPAVARFEALFERVLA